MVGGGTFTFFLCLGAEFVLLVVFFVFLPFLVLVFMLVLVGFSS